MEILKSQKIIPWFVSLLLISIFSGCDKLSQRTSTLSLGTQTLPFTVTIETKEKISTLTPSPTTPPIFATAAAVPTLKAEDANKRLLELLEISGDCHLPCWWGIIPEKTTSQDAAAILNSFSTISLKNP